MNLTIRRLNDKTNRITAHFLSGKTDTLDVPRAVNGHEIIDFILRVCDKR